MPAGLVTDSNAQLPHALIERYAISVVPIVVTVDGRDYLEGVDLDADGFYALFADGTPEVSTSQPSPGDFIAVYRALEERGCDEIVSVHVTEAMSGTLNSARLAAAMVDVPVHLVDSRTASFGVGCCAWQLGEDLSRGRSVAEAVASAERLADELYSVTALGAADLLERSGRAPGAAKLAAGGDGVDVFLAGPGGSFESVGAGSSPDEVCDLMAATMRRDGAPIRVAVGIADHTAAPYYEGLEQRLAARDDVVDIVRYRIGPSVGAFTGPGTAGGFWYPVR